MKYLESILEVIDNYDAILCDMNGVLHDGKSVFEGVFEMLEKIKNKNFVLVSNATRTAEMVRESLLKMGFSNYICRKIVTSGDVLRNVMCKRKSVFSELGNTYNLFMIGNTNFLEGLPESVPDIKINIVDSIEDTNCILLNGVPSDIKFDNYIFFEDILKRNIPFVCTNPDQIALSGDTFVQCPGYAAAVYRNMGGHVYEYGKPHKIIYEYIFEKYPEITSQNVLCVGDTLVTDIKGAENCGFDSVLIMSGVLKKMKKEKSSMSDLCARYGVEPTYYTERFGISQN